MICHIIEISEENPIVCTTGKASRELFEIREYLGQGRSNGFLTVGSMGYAGSIALGIALQKSDKTIWCIDGDGAADTTDLCGVAVACGYRYCITVKDVAALQGELGKIQIKKGPVFLEVECDIGVRDDIDAMRQRRYSSISGNGRYDMDTANEIKKLRTGMGMNRKEFCDYYNIPYRTVTDWEAGKRKMPEYVLELMEFKADIEQLKTAGT